MTQQELEERLAKLEGAMGQHSQRLDTLTSDVQGLAGAKREHEKRLDKQTLRIASLELWRDDAATAAADIGDIERRVGEAEQVAATAQRMAIAVDSAMTAHAGRIAELEKAKIVAQAATAQAPAKKPLPKEVERSIALMRKYGYFGDAASLEEFIREELGL